MILFLCTFIAFLILLKASNPFFLLKEKYNSKEKEDDLFCYFDLADLADYLLLSIEAGATLPASFERATLASRKGRIQEGCLQVLYKKETGYSFSQSLQQSLQDCPSKILSEFLETLALSVRMGTDVAKTIESQSLSLKDSAARSIEEQAMTVPVKMLFPLVLFILPCIFILLGANVLFGLVQSMGGV